MLIVNELRSGIIEFTDENRTKSRNFKVMVNRLMNYLIVLSMIVLILLLLLDYQWLSLLIASVFISSIFLQYFTRKLLVEDIQGFQIVLDKNNQVTKLYVQTWIRGSNTELILDDIRYNQSVGLKAIMNDFGLIEVYIIVDRDYPGELIFSTMDLDTLSEIKHSFTIVFPNKNEWYIDGDWSDEDIEIFEEEIILPKIPHLLREYFPVKI